MTWTGHSRTMEELTIDFAVALARAGRDDLVQAAIGGRRLAARDVAVRVRPADSFPLVGVGQSC